MALLKEEYKLKLSYGHTCMWDRIASEVDLIMTGLSESQIWIELEGWSIQRIPKEVLGYHSFIKIMGDNSCSLYLALLHWSSISTILLLHNNIIFNFLDTKLKSAAWRLSTFLNKITSPRQPWASHWILIAPLLFLVVVMPRIKNSPQFCQINIEGPTSGLLDPWHCCLPLTRCRT